MLLIEFSNILSHVTYSPCYYLFFVTFILINRDIYINVTKDFK